MGLLSVNFRWKTFMIWLATEDISVDILLGSIPAVLLSKLKYSPDLIKQSVITNCYKPPRNLLYFPLYRIKA